MNEQRTLLIEIGTEELPPALVPGLAEDFLAQLRMKLKAEQYDTRETAAALCTPRRIAAKIAGVATHQPTKTVARKGPPATRIDESDAATQGFAKSCGVAVKQLELRDGRLFCHAETGGHSLAARLAELLPAVLNQLLIPRRMRWGEGAHSFARPVHWLCVLHGDEVVPCELFGVKAGRVTYGHRHHCPQSLELAHADDYEATLEEQGRVLADFAARSTQIEQRVGPAAPSLLHETAATTEWPQTLSAGFAPAFLTLPSEVITQTLEHALKVFPKRDAKGQVLAKFTIVADIESSDPQTIVRGYENVVRARLEDARFFFEQDKKTSLEARRAMLKRTLFQKKLGTLADKAARLEKLAAFLAPHCEASPAHTQRAAQLCKCDLGTDLVGEYPKLQGVMGGCYAANDGEHDAVAAAIKEHYLPQGRDADTPATPAGAALALADKTDTLAGFLGVGLTPSGSKDPYGLRRAANGVIRILLEREIDLDVNALIAAAVSAYGDLFQDRDAVHQTVCDYITEQLHNCLSAGMLAGRPAIKPDRVEAVANAQPSTTRPLDFYRRLEAIDTFTRDPAADSLIAASKRTRNILAKTDAAKIKPSPHANAMTEDAERDLREAVDAARKTFDQQLGAGDYLGAMKTLAALRAPVDRFFDEVLVMSENKKERDNRLALLNDLRVMFLKIADFSALNPDQPETKK